MHYLEPGIYIHVNLCTCTMYFQCSESISMTYSVFSSIVVVRSVFEYSRISLNASQELGFSAYVLTPVISMLYYCDIVYLFCFTKPEEEIIIDQYSY